ncbi:unnamed protein product [Haemonchus placei]|uniref:Secreted protein n=1 Tax=Haemonchus placei TaxID=6290 RepID=A0A0N4VSD1_HAEPC|nr:unnamed protein product [Haemonchus placei]
MKSRTKIFWKILLMISSQVPGFGVAGGNTLRQFNLILIQPVQNNKEVIDVLTSRKEDKEAVEFLRSIATAY